MKLLERHPLGCAVLLCLAAAAAVALMLIAAMDPPDEPATVRTSVARPTADIALLDVGTTTTTTTAAPPTTTTTAPPPTTTTTTSTTVVVHQAPPAPADGWTWDELADCESGEWDRHRRPIPGSRNWADTRGGYEGGVHFAPSTWDGFKPVGFPDGAHQATREQQIAVAERVLDRQGPGAWPVCSYKVGMR